MQSVSSRIWTRVAVSISYDDNHYTTGTPKETNNFKYDIFLIRQKLATTSSSIILSIKSSSQLFLIIYHDGIHFNIVLLQWLLFLLLNNYNKSDKTLTIQINGIYRNQNMYRTHRILWDSGMKTNYSIPARRSNLAIINKKLSCHLF